MKSPKAARPTPTAPARLPRLPRRARHRSEVRRDNHLVGVGPVGVCLATATSFHGAALAKVAKGKASILRVDDKDFARHEGTWKAPSQRASEMSLVYPCVYLHVCICLCQHGLLLRHGEYILLSRFSVYASATYSMPLKAGKGKDLESLNQSCRQSCHVRVKNAGKLQRQIVSTIISCSASLKKHAGSASAAPYVSCDNMLIFDRRTHLIKYLAASPHPVPVFAFIF